ncbi:hypothetical protein CHS0354_019537 [Potamilus streckersoni]|uniref:Carbonyl reductase n=1 Tax=Potamilus streckersoni TaxID=2493646 RepID=A0AAE0VWM4_9BIVA|nr:hypothetical protein CHS0354_019537 [Potamilus streckersoni]
MNYFPYVALVQDLWRMGSTKRVAVVTGANKGIGFAIVRGLCKQFQGDVFLTARDEDRGMKAVEDLKKEGLNPLFHQLDISDPTSIQTLKAFLQKQYGGLDILVNNAAIANKLDAQIYFTGTAKIVTNVNIFVTGYISWNSKSNQIEKCKTSHEY